MTCKRCGHSADEHDFTAMIDDESGDLVWIEAEERYIEYGEVDTPCFHGDCDCLNYEDDDTEDLAIPVEDLIVEDSL